MASILDPLAPRRAIGLNDVLAGIDYTSKLIEFGLRPHLVCWTYPHARGEAELAIVTPLVELVGPLSIYEVLFAAYDAATLPREIDPFRITLYGDKSNLGIDLVSAVHRAGIVGRYFMKEGEAVSMDRTDIISGIVDPVSIPGYGVIYLDDAKFPGVEHLGKWRRFEKEALKTAA